MGARETVMSKEQLNSVLNNWHYGLEKSLEDLGRSVAELQVEITRKATLKEVGEWLKLNVVKYVPPDLNWEKYAPPHEYEYIEITRRDLEAFLQGEIPRGGR